MHQQKHIYRLAVIGSSDFVRRMSAAARQISSPKLTVFAANLAEARSVVFAERPHILLADVGLKTSKRDLLWLRSFFTQVRERYGKEISIVLAVTAPEKFAFGGSLLFRDNETLEPSSLVDNFIIAAPAGIPKVPSLEDQLRDCLSYITEVFENNQGRGYNLPALWDDGWVPVMCDPESRNVWMRWLPRYARYVNENPIIVGPTGAGKTRLAQAIHQLSGRDGPFVSITPRDFSSTELVQAELFGAVAGAYTGAVEKWGLVKKADRGTLFIDELQSIDRDLQGKLITFVENKSYRRVGEAESHSADVRFIFATNRPLQELINDDSLRDDFAYRLERLQIQLSHLHKRRLDISAGICYALARVQRERAKARGKSAAGAATAPALEGISPGAYQVLFRAQWPGNLRQLENTVARLIELAEIRGLKLIDRECALAVLEGLLGQTELNATDIFETASVQTAIRARSDGFHSLTDCVLEVADRARLEALDVTGGDVQKAAELIGDSKKAMQLFAASRGQF